MVPDTERLRVARIVTAYQSAVTILHTKLLAFAEFPDFESVLIAPPPDPGETRRPPVPHLAVEMSRRIDPIADWRSAAQVMSLLREYRPHIVHTHTAKAGVVGLAAAKLASVPIVFHTYHGTPFFEGQNPVQKGVYWSVEMACNALRSAILCQNEADYEYLCESPFVRRPVELEGNGVDIDRIQEWARSGRDEVSSRSRAGAIKLIVVSRLEPVKRVAKAIEGVEFLRSQGLDVHCIIAGKGHLENELRETVEERGLGHCVEVLYTPHVHALIAAADIAVLTSEKEGVPRGVMEAMALRKPVVATDVVGTREVVAHGETGLLVPLEDQDALNRALLRLAVDPELRSRFGQAGLERIENHFDERRIPTRWAELYRGFAVAKGLIPASVG